MRSRQKPRAENAIGNFGWMKVLPAATKLMSDEIAAGNFVQ